MKKLFILFTCLIVVFGLSACSGLTDVSPNAGNEAKDGLAQTKKELDAQTSEKPSSSGKTLVVYYSATGTTEKVANMIAESLSADIFKIEPAPEYTSADLNWNDSESRVSREHNDSSLRNVELKTTLVDNWNEYDTVFIGYPIWWGIAAWPTNTFVKNNDFSGKKVIPFATSASSGMGNSAKELQDLANTGDWQTGMRFSSGVSTDEINNWLKEIVIMKN